MAKIIKHVDDVPVYEDDLVYLEDWMRVEGISFDEDTDQDEKESVKDDFYEWAEENNLTAQDC